MAEKIKFAFHVHTDASHDCFSRPVDIINYCRKQGIHAIAICDHNETKGALSCSQLANGNPFVIVCEEIKTKSGEVIGMFLDKQIPKGLSLEDTLSQIKAQGGLVALPHPGESLRKVALTKEVAEKIAKDADLIEGFNSRTLFNKDNIWAEELAKRHKKPFLAGSDAHFIYNIGLVLNEMPAFNSKETFMEAIKRNTIIQSRRTGIFNQALSKFLKVYYKWFHS